MATFFQGSPTASRRRPLQSYPEMSDFSQPLDVPESVRQQWQPTAQQRAEIARLDAQWNQMMQQGYQPPTFRPGQAMGLGGGYAQAAPPMPSLNRPSIPQIAMSPQGNRFRRMLAYTGSQGTAPQGQPPAPGTPESPFPSLPGLPVSPPPQMAAVDNIPLAASGMRMLPVEPIRHAPELRRMQVPLQPYGGAIYVDPANVPAGHVFQMGRPGPFHLSGVSYVRNPNDAPITLRSNGDGTVAVISTSPARRLSDEERQQNIDRNRERREVTAMFRNMNRNRRARGQAALSRVEFEKLFPQFARTEKEGTQGVKNRRELIKSEALANAANSLPDGQAKTPEDSQRFAFTAAQSVFQQFKKKNQSWEDALEAARELDKQQIESGILLDGISIEDELKKLKEREEAGEQGVREFRNSGYRQNPAGFMMMNNTGLNR